MSKDPKPKARGATKDIEYVIGVDTGGTFTDVLVIDSDGQLIIGKAETTPGELAKGVLNAIADAASKVGLTLEQMLRQTSALVQGTTIGTNILINRNGVKTGMITTKGFEDTTHIMRSLGRIDGLSPDEVRHQATVAKPVPIVPKTLIRGVAERVDSTGKVVIPLNTGEIEQATKTLVAEGCDAIAICFLWSHLNPAHEVKAMEIVKKTAPNVYVDMSHQVGPLIREYGRFNTAAMDCYIGPIMEKWYRELDGTLRTKGFGKELLTAQVWGGVMPYKSMLPIGTINSGPVGGVIGSKRIATEVLKINNVVTTDVGGTSFDVSVIAEGRHVYAREKPIMRFRVNIPMIDVTSIGAGGGTIGWADPAGGLKMGPVSAGSLPGPACYMKGGTEPTSTDADVALGIFDPDYFLAGRVKLNKDAAMTALKKLADKVKMDPIEVAVAMAQINDEHMADLLRLVVTRTGYDPRDFSVFCFGGGGPTHGPFYSNHLGFNSVYMFPQSAVWSAFGLASADVSRIFDKSVFYRMPIKNDELTRLFEELEKAAIDEMTYLKFKAEDIVLTREVSMKFGRQVNVERIPVARKKYTAKDVQKIQDDFVEFYRSVYGEGAGFVEAGMELLSIHVAATIPAARPELPRFPVGTADASKAIKSKRDVYWIDKGKWVMTRIYDGHQLKSGHVIPGPGIVETETTTITVPHESELQIDEYGFYKLVYR